MRGSQRSVLAVASDSRNRENAKADFASFTDRDGTPRIGSTGGCDGQGAMKIAEQFERGPRRKRTAHRGRTLISDLHRETAGEDLPSVTVHGFLAEWAP